MSPADRRGLPTGAAPPPEGRLPLVLAVIFLATAQWSGVVVASIQASDIALLLTLVFAARAATRPAGGRPLPVGACVLVATVCLASVLSQLHPPAPSYLLGRDVITSFAGGKLGPRAGVSNAGFGPTLVIVKLVLATVGAWAVVRELLARRPRNGATVIAGAWLVGALLSAAVATVQWAGVDILANQVAHVVGDRPSGLAFHPDSLGFYVATSIPLLSYLFKRRTLIPVGLAAGVLLWCGLLAADSRSALLLGLLGTLALPVCAVRPGRAVAGAATVGLLISPLVIAALIYLRTGTRLAPGAGAGSDAGHTRFALQALRDFRHSPLFGIGFQHAIGAPLVPVSVLASGGVIAFIGYLFFWGWTYVRVIPQLANREVRVFCVCATVVLITNLGANNFTDRGEYVFGSVAVLIATRTRAAVLAGPAQSLPTTWATDRPAPYRRSRLGTGADLTSGSRAPVETGS